jgi:peptidoglycan/xylan/chitin deacetylase (PgdA/CDA1 family)
MFPGQAKEPVMPEGKVIYLTFDDGPCAYTNQLLDILKKYKVKATFFVIRPKSSKNITILKRIAEEGHTIGMHCSEHTYKEIYASEEAYFEDLKLVQDAIYEHTGVISTIVRFPGGSSNTVSKFNPGIMTRLTKMLDAMGYRYFDWSVGSSDAGGVFTQEAVFQNVIGGVQTVEVPVVLQHDIKLFSVKAVEDIIKWGKKMGYTFLPLADDSPEVEFRVKN